MGYPRAAFLPDTFHEVNGVAHTSRQFEAFARRQGVPLLSIHCGDKVTQKEEGSVTVLELKRGPAKIGLDANLDYDPLLFRYARRVEAEIKQFGADLIHVTGPGDMGVLGWYVAWRLKLPLIMSWHTSLHEYAGRRLERVLGFAGPRVSRWVGRNGERFGLAILRWFYRRATASLAPNPELVEQVSAMTGKPVSLMKRGVDTALFSPARRQRMTGTFRIGYVGRLTSEKNVRFLAELQRSLAILGRSNAEFIVVGEGVEKEWLRRNMPGAVLTGVLRGERLAEIYANLDLFVFPSHTDTFGNVVLEALASGVPAVVTSNGGPKYLIEPGVTGFVAESDWAFVQAVNALMTDWELLQKMRLAARKYASAQSWDTVFEKVMQSYGSCLDARREGATAEVGHRAQINSRLS